MWRSLLSSTDPKVLLASDCCKTRDSAQKSTIQHARAVYGVFSSQNVEKNGVARSYYGLLAYTSLERELRAEQQYGEGYLEATLESLRKWPVELEKKVSDSKCQECSFRVAPAPFCVMQYISVPRCLEGNKEGTENGRVEARKTKLAVQIFRDSVEGGLECMNYNRWLLLETSKLEKSSLCTTERSACSRQ